MNRFVLRRIHSLTGVVPVGLFLAEHLWTNASALGGRASFEHAVSAIQEIPLLPAVELFGIVLPLAFHALYGVKLSLETKPNVGTYVYAKNWLYFLQRLTGIGTLVFIGVHLYEYRVQKWLFGMSHHTFFDVLTAHLSWSWGGVPWIAVGYLLGITAATFHFANGLAGFAMTWGITTTRESQRRAVPLWIGIGSALFALGASTVVYFATGATPFASP
jgi:succinate dehydrogenase/fumarate reductase cytochrome b subunit (b558 family)